MSKKKESSLEKADRLIRGARSRSRIDATVIFYQENRKDLLLQWALVEKDQMVLDNMRSLLFPEPLEFVAHYLAMQRGPDASGALRWYFARSNYLYAESAIHEAYSKKKKLTVDAIEGIGQGYFRSLTKHVSKHLGAPILSYADAKISQPKAFNAGTRVPVDSDGSDTLARTSDASVEAAYTLSLLDEVVPVAEVQRMLFELEDRIKPCHARSNATGKLRFVLYKLGKLKHWDEILDQGSRSDALGAVALCLLREGEIGELKKLLDWATAIDGKPRLEFAKSKFLFQPGFLYWPLIEWFHLNDLLDMQTLARVDDDYVRGRNFGQAPPPWWTWQSSWHKIDMQIMIRGGTAHFA